LRGRARGPGLGTAEREPAMKPSKTPLAAKHRLGQPEVTWRIATRDALHVLLSCKEFFVTFRILSFCGGGVRGYMSALILNKISFALFESRGVWLHEIADCFAGTSTGSFIAGMLLAGQSPEVIVEAYKNIVIPGCQAASKNKDATKPAIPSSKLIYNLDRFSLDPRLRDLPKKGVFTSFDLGGKVGETITPWSAQLLHNFPGSTTADFGLFDAVAASGAMPGISPPLPVTIDGRSYNLVDGAFVHHDPTLPAIALAVASGVPLNSISVLDIGTGFMANYVSAADASQWGSQQWLHGSGNTDGQLPPLLVNTPWDAANEMPIFNLSLSGTSTNLMPMLARLMLGDQFAYLNPDFGNTVIGELSAEENDIAFLYEQAMGLVVERAMFMLKRYWI
jgi:predicted acylesterase/phospholipase RssA